MCPQYPGPCRRGGGTSVTRRHPARTPAPDPHSRTAGAGRCDNHQRFWLVGDPVLPQSGNLVPKTCGHHLPSDSHLKLGFSLLNICISHNCFKWKEVFYDKFMGHQYHWQYLFLLQSRWWWQHKSSPAQELDNMAILLFRCDMRRVISLRIL